MAVKVGKQSIGLSRVIAVTTGGSVVGPREGEGPMGDRFDVVTEDTLVGEQSWEKAEAKMMEMACRQTLTGAGRQADQIDFLLAGDLLNQLIAANFCARELSIPFIGLFGACSTMVEAMLLGSVLIDGGSGTSVLCAASSHHDTAERQYRFPTEFANQRPPSAQWTVTGAGAVLLDAGDGWPRITHGTVGRVVDMGMQDPNNMGAAMAAAAAETIWQHLQDTGRQPSDYDVVVTGDLGRIGRQIVVDLLHRSGIDLNDRLQDCGTMIYSLSQDAHAGGSGGGCCATVFAAHFLPKLQASELSRLLLVGTGALFSPTSAQQGESIPCVAHAVALEGQP